jgi:hypothetical protein
MPSCLLLIAALAAQDSPSARKTAVEPVIAVWYRGTPAGTPRQDDLAAIRAQGFTGVTWPAGQTARIDDVRRMADRVGLAVSVQSAPAPLTPVSALTPAERVDVVVSPLAIETIPALVWRAVAHGARTIAFDAGSGSGTPLTDATGRPLPWVAPASAIARQLTFNARLFLDARAGPRVAIQPPAPSGVDVVLLETARAWMLVATNTSDARVTTVAELPAEVPPALWTSLLDGSGLSMLSRPSGPRWTFELAPGEAQIWVIDK